MKDKVNNFISLVVLYKDIKIKLFMVIFLLFSLKDIRVFNWSKEIKILFFLNDIFL